MAILNNNPLVGASGNQGGYNINNSLRFRSSASAYLSRTPASAGNRKTWTWSGWVKRGSLGSTHTLLSTTNGSGTYTEIRLINDVIGIQSNLIAAPNEWLTNAVFRDPSAWYHIVVTVDTTAATAANRIKVWVNSSTQTFSQSPTVTLNDDLYINAAVSHSLGRRDTGSLYFDGYLAEVNFIDGSAKTPSDFGETDTTTGVWKPKAYSGTYGTNGFYLKFSDIATTSGSNAGLGKDFSGNSNYWTTNNISVTAGTTYDAMTDSPTNTSATVANYCTWNPLVSPNATYSNGNLRFAGTANNVWISPTMGVSSGKFYWECTVEAISSTILHIGITQLNGAITEAALIARTYYGDGTKYSFQTGTISGTSFGSSYAVNDIIQVALDMDSGKVWFGKNNTWQASGNPSAGTNEAYSGLSGTFGPFAGKDAVGNQPTVVLNCGQRPFAYTPPTGFVRLNTFNLPTPTILQGNKYMDATLYTADTAGGKTITNSGSMQPDLVWIKNRDNAENHYLMDAVRGAGTNKYLQSNTTSAETSAAFGDALVTPVSNGFSITDSNYNAGEIYFNGRTYVAWQWQAGQGSTSSNTSGSITSTVSVNTTAGFSVVTYTGTGTAATVGHGLGVAPKWVVVKRRNGGGTENWMVYHAAVTTPNANPGNNRMLLNLTNASNTDSAIWNNTNPTSSVFSLGTSSEVNANTGTYVAYCWAEIAGFSKFGSYTGNGSTDGPFVYLGFRPKFIITKVYSTSGYNWNMYDSSRGTYNVADQVLIANGSGAEETGFDPIDFLSNGFKLRMGNRGSNVSGASYIYMAFAENPFKNSLAR